MHRYQIILFRNRVQCTRLFKCRTLIDARKKYNKLIEEVKPPFHVETKNKKSVEYFVGMVLQEKTDKQPAHAKDYMGRNVTMQVRPHQTLMELSQYFVPEKIYDNQSKKHIYFDDLMSQLDAIPGLKMVYKLNSHVFVEADQNLRFYSLKNVSDCLRLINVLIEERMKGGRMDCMFARDMNRQHRSYLYQHLANNDHAVSKMKRHYSR
jgi:hypothetical protein